MRKYYRAVCALLILVSLVLPCFASFASSRENEAGDLHALVYYGAAGNACSLASSVPGATILEDYGSFAHVRITEEQLSSLRGMDAVVQLLPNIGKIKFDAISFDTSNGPPAIPPEFRADEPANGEYGYYVVQMKGPPKSEWIKTIEESGAQIMDLVNYYAYIVKMKHETKNVLLQKEFISWLGLYQPFYKLRCGARDLHGVVDFNVIFFKTGGFADNLAQLRSAGIALIYSSEDTRWDCACVRADFSKMKEISAIPGVWFIEPALRAEPDSSLPSGNSIYNDGARWVLQSFINGSTPVWDNGLHGEGIIVGIADTGIDYDHSSFTNTTGDHGTPGPWHRKIVRYMTDFGDNWDNSTPFYCHGSHTSGSIAGNNISNPGQYNKYDGMAYMSRLAFADLQNQYTFLPPSNITKMFLDAYDNGARSHSDSWGYPSGGSYDSLAQGADQFQWDHPDFLEIISAGNEGKASMTIRSPGIAKNVLTVGACNNTENADQMPWFSSRGPTPDGVRKPDVLAPGWNIMSVAGDDDQNNYESGYKMISGTSMATPIVAGGCALVEQYFREGFYPTGEKNPADGFMPSGPLRKAVLVNSGRDVPGADARVPDNSQGWGRVTLDDALYFKGDTGRLWLYDDYGTGSGLGTGAKYTKSFKVSGTLPLKVSLVWNDYPGAGLKNDLNLMVKSPSGATYIGSNYLNGESVPDAGAQPDAVNSVECVYIKNPEDGYYTLEVTAASISSGGAQHFSIVATGALSIYGVELNTPKSSETIPGGTTYDINWTTTEGTLPVTVEILWSNDSGVTYVSLAAGEPATGKWQWNVPALDIATARVKVIAIDGNSNSTSDDSGDFNISTSVAPEMMHSAAIVACGFTLAFLFAVAVRRRRKG